MIRNLVTLSIWPGAYQDRAEPANIEFDGGIEAIKATNLVLRDNVVAGSERLGFHTRGEECTGSSAWSGNEAHSNMVAVGLYPKETAVSSDCVRYANFIAWKNLDYGFYYQNDGSFEGENLVSVENGVGVFTFIVGPSAVGHQTSNKYVHVKKSLIVGKTTAFDCNSDVIDTTDTNIKLSGQARSWGNGTHGKVGISWPNFSQGSDNARLKPHNGMMAYMAISGVMYLSNITFANFDASCSSSQDYAITTNPTNDDFQHPIESSSLTFHNVNDANKVFIHVPNVGKINPSDCVDMDCDAMKKALLKDQDGSLLGSPGAVLPLSEFEWNGDSRRGLGDYRVPKVMQTAQDGTRIPLSTVAPRLDVETSISNGVALGTMDVLPNGTVALSMGLVTATPPVGSSEWSEASEDDKPITLNKAGSVSPHETPVPGREGKMFDTPIRLRVYDEDAQPLSLVGSGSSPWQVSATLNFGSGSHANATLQGITTVSFSSGWANFTDLAITLPGSDYSITFTVTDPAEAANFSATVTSLTVLPTQVTAEMVSTTTDPLEGDQISLTLELKDQDTGSALSDITWRGHTWDAYVSMSSNQVLNGTLNMTFNPSTGRVQYTDLTISEIGRYYLTFSVVSSPTEYNFTIETYVDVTTAALQNIVVEKSNTCQFSFAVTYDPVQSPKDASQFANIWAIKNKNNGVRMTGSSAAPGWNCDVTSMVSDLCSQVQDGTTKYSFGGLNVSMSPYMMVDGQSYYGTSCGAAPTPYNLHQAILAAIIVLSITVVILVVAIIIWKVKVVPKTKKVATLSQIKYLGHVNTPWQAEDFICRDDFFLRMKGGQVMSPTAPADTHPAAHSNRFELYGDRNHTRSDTHSTTSVNFQNKYDLYVDRPSTSGRDNNMPRPAE